MKMGDNCVSDLHHLSRLATFSWGLDNMSLCLSSVTSWWINFVFIFFYTFVFNNSIEEFADTKGVIRIRKSKEEQTPQ